MEIAFVTQLKSFSNSYLTTFTISITFDHFIVLSVCYITRITTNSPYFNGSWRGDFAFTVFCDTYSRISSLLFFIRTSPLFRFSLSFLCFQSSFLRFHSSVFRFNSIIFSYNEPFISLFLCFDFCSLFFIEKFFVSDCSIFMFRVT